MKKRKPSRGKPAEKNAVMSAVKGAVFALVITIAAVLAFALIVKGGQIGDDVISAVNQLLKVACIFIAALIATKKPVENRIMTGAMAGAIYVVLGFLTFSLIEGAFGDILTMFADLAMGIIIGLLTGAIMGRMGTKKKA